MDAPEGGDAVTPARRPRLSARLRLADASRRDSLASGLVGAGLTLAFLLAVGISAGSSFDSIGAAPQSELHDEERLVFWTPAELLAAEPEAPSDPRDAPATSGTPRAQPAPRPGVTAPALRSPGDSASSGGGQPAPDAPTAGLLRPALPGGRLPSPSELGGAAASRGSKAGAPCIGPCLESAAAGYAINSEIARRAAANAALGQKVVERAGPPVDPPGFQVGLPGGGPTKAERQRDSTLHAEYRSQLHLFMQRFDSLQADSLARGLKKEPPPER